jgi:hypothetical protein
MQTHALEVQLLSFLTLALDTGKWLTLRPSCCTVVQERGTHWVVTEPIRTFCSKINPEPAGISTPDCPSRSPVNALYIRIALTSAVPAKAPLP